jgi:uncharacterized protein with HEPN domain
MKDSILESKRRLEHIEEAIINIEKFTKGQSLESFCSNDILWNAVLMQFIIIGEAIVNVDNNKLEKYSYPWYKVRSFRNMIAHEYFNIKLNAVWLIVESELPLLKTTIRKIIENEF